MVNPSDSAKPLFLQIRELIEDQIVNDQLKEGDQAPSTNQLVNFYKINHATVSKGITQLVDEGILFKKRGIGMFVAEGAKKTLVQQRKKRLSKITLLALYKKRKNSALRKQKSSN